MKNVIYLDYNATTPVDPAVYEAMKPFLETHFGNPSSSHAYGTIAKQAVEKARQQVAQLLHANPDEVIFTGGGTESNNLSLKGAAFALKSKGNHIITSAVEHPAVLEVCKYLLQQGFTVTYLPVNAYGMVDPDEIRKNLTAHTILISVMHANNEVGTIQPVEEIGRIARENGILFHTDAAQSVGKIPVDVNRIGVDLLSVAGHKFYAPKGIGALFIRRGVKPVRQMHGANHESNIRAGTENVPYIVALGCAAALSETMLSSYNEISADHAEMIAIRDLLEEGIMACCPEVRLNGHPTERLPNTLSLGFPGVDASLLLHEMRGIAASAGAACHSDRQEISPVLQAMGLPLEFAAGTIRFSTGRMTTREQITEAIGLITSAYRKMKRSSFRHQIPAPRFMDTVDTYQGKSGESISSSPAALTSAELKQQVIRETLTTAGPVKLTEFTHALGCACKIRPQMLERILKDIPLPWMPEVLVGHDTSDDAAVFALDAERALVQTVDFIPPVVDDPYEYGAIAAANAISDVYAMGGEPAFALSIVGFPDRMLPEATLKEIIKGATDKAAEAGIGIIGGHTIEDPEPKFGLVVTGFVNRNKVWRNATAKEGDVLILTKPLGTGILMTATKHGLTRKAEVDNAVRIMSLLNRQAAEKLREIPVSACTDISGFGLLGHLKEMVRNRDIDAEVFFEKAPLLDTVMQHAAAGAIPGGTLNNFDYVADLVTWPASIPELLKYVLCDAQTSGGLLISLPGAYAAGYLSGFPDEVKPSMIGRIIRGAGRILIR